MEKKNILVYVLLLSLVVIFLGVSTAVFFYLGKGTTNNVIQTGRIVFSYNETEFGNAGSGIDIVEALPTPDINGKLLSAPNEYFDFSVSASTTSTDLAYEIVVNKQEESTMPEDMAKIYLTEFLGLEEVETEITGGENTPTYASLNDTVNTQLEGKTIYYGTVKAGEIAYGKKFRLRMWVSDKADSMEMGEKKFTVKVNVAAIGNN